MLLLALAGHSTRQGAVAAEPPAPLPTRRQPLLQLAPRTPAREPAPAVSCGEAPPSAGAVALEIPTTELFDLGVVDADGDGKLDLFTTNHNDRQGLLLGDGRGGFRDVATEWGLDATPGFPRWESRWNGPAAAEKGLFIHRVRTGIALALQGIAGARVTIDSPLPVKVREERNAEIAVESAPRLLAPAATRVRVELRDGSRTVLRPARDGVDVAFDVAGVSPDDVHVGPGRHSPRRGAFVLRLLDRHGLAWSDVDGDGALDLFASRGGLRGLIEEMTPTDADLAAGAQAPIEDELLLSRPGGLVDVRAQAGLEKGGCRARDAAWVDVDGDGDLDLSIVCEQTPCSVARRDAGGCFRESAGVLGLDQSDVQSELWLPLDAGAGPELVRARADGIWQYQRRGGAFAGERIDDLKAADWLRPADMDADGDLDLLAASCTALRLFRNDEGRLERQDGDALGLPRGACGAAWVDGDGDGRLELLLVPHGIYARRDDGTFHCVSRPPEVAAALFGDAFASFPDVDGDGGRELLLAARPDINQPVTVTLRPGPPPQGHWLQVELAGPPGNPEGRGAILRAFARGGVRAAFPGEAEGSRHSQGHSRVYLVLGADRQLDLLEVIWPDGRVSRFEHLDGDRLVVLAHPEGRPRGTISAGSTPLLSAP